MVLKLSVQVVRAARFGSSSIINRDQITCRVDVHGRFWGWG
jgi:hypothetical protein